MDMFWNWPSSHAKCVFPCLQEVGAKLKSDHITLALSVFTLYLSAPIATNMNKLHDELGDHTPLRFITTCNIYFATLYYMP